MTTSSHRGGGGGGGGGGGMEDVVESEGGGGGGVHWPETTRLLGPMLKQRWAMVSMLPALTFETTQLTIGGGWRPTTCRYISCVCMDGF